MADKKELSFEEILEKLEEIVKRLEVGDVLLSWFHLRKGSNISNIVKMEYVRLDVEK